MYIPAECILGLGKKTHNHFLSTIPVL